MMKKIIENTDAAQQDFIREADAVQSGGGGSNTINLSSEELAALLQGACIAVDDGEYSTFIVLDAAAHQASAPD